MGKPRYVRTSGTQSSLRGRYSTEQTVPVSDAELSEAATGILEQFPGNLSDHLPTAEEVASRLGQLTNQYKLPLGEARRAAVSQYWTCSASNDDLEFPGQIAADSHFRLSIKTSNGWT